MAQRVNTFLVDDLDGSNADETVTFGLDGVEYEADLSDENATALRNALSDYIEAARRTGGRAKRGRTTVASGQGASREHTRAVREWWRSQGNEISDRGRVPNHVNEAFEQAHQGVAA